MPPRPLHPIGEDDRYATNLDQRFWEDEFGDTNRSPRWIRIFQEFSGDPEKGFSLIEETNVVSVDFNNVAPVRLGLSQSQRDVPKHLPDLLLDFAGEYAVGGLPVCPVTRSISPTRTAAGIWVSS